MVLYNTCGVWCPCMRRRLHWHTHIQTTQLWVIITHLCVLLRNASDVFIEMSVLCLVDDGVLLIWGKCIGPRFLCIFPWWHVDKNMIAIDSSEMTGCYTYVRIEQGSGWTTLYGYWISRALQPGHTTTVAVIVYRSEKPFDAYCSNAYPLFRVLFNYLIIIALTYDWGMF